MRRCTMYFVFVHINYCIKFWNLLFDPFVIDVFLFNLFNAYVLLCYNICNNICKDKTFTKVFKQ